MTLKNITAKVGYVKSWAILNLPAHLCGLAFRAARLEPKRNNGWFYTRLSLYHCRRVQLLLSVREKICQWLLEMNLYSSVWNNQRLRNEDPSIPLRLPAAH